MSGRGIAKHGHTAGDSTTREYNAWVAMRSRCENPKNERYHRYGGRGIRVCDPWRKSFETFLSDMGSCPPGMSIDRKDNDGDYEPENCRWATELEQANSRSNNRRIEYMGQVRTLAEWSRELKMEYGRLQSRLDRGWSVEMAFDKRIKRRQKPKKKPSAKRRAKCVECGRGFLAVSNRNRFCSAYCRKTRTKSDWYEANRDAINERRRARYGIRKRK